MSQDLKDIEILYLKSVSDLLTTLKNTAQKYFRK